VLLVRPDADAKMQSGSLRWLNMAHGSQRVISASSGSGRANLPVSNIFTLRAALAIVPVHAAIRQDSGDRSATRDPSKSIGDVSTRTTSAPGAKCSVSVPSAAGRAAPPKCDDQSASCTARFASGAPMSDHAAIEIVIPVGTDAHSRSDATTRIFVRAINSRSCAYARSSPRLR